MADIALRVVRKKTQAEIDAVPIVDGQLLYTTGLGDDNRIYNDVGNSRILISTGYSNGVVVDESFSTTSSNPISNKTVANKINEIEKNREFEDVILWKNPSLPSNIVQVAKNNPFNIDLNGCKRIFITFAFSATNSMKSTIVIDLNRVDGTLAATNNYVQMMSGTPMYLANSNVRCVKSVNVDEVSIAFGNSIIIDLFSDNITQVNNENYMIPLYISGIK